MSSRTAAGRKRLQQPKPPKTTSFKSPFKKNFTSDAKLPSSPSSLPASLSSPAPNYAPFRQPYYLSDNSDAEDVTLPVPSALASQTPSSESQWHPQIIKSSSNALGPRGPSEINYKPTRVPPSSYTAPGPPHSFHPYPSPPRSTEESYSRGSISSDPSLRTPISSERGPSPLLLQQEFRSGQTPMRYGSAPAIVTGSSQSSSSVNHALYSQHYPSPPGSSSDPLSPLTLSPASAAHSTLPSLISESSSDSASIMTNLNAVGSSTSLAVNTPASIFSSSSGSSGESERRSPSAPNKKSPGFVYPSSRSLGRPSPGGPKFKFKNKKDKGKGLALDAIPDEAIYSAQNVGDRVVPSRATSAGLRLSMVGPSSISAPSLKSPRSFSSSGNSSGSSMKSSDPGFVYPTARSRAHPNARPQKFRKKKTLDHFEDEVDKSAQKFMGISLNRRRKSNSKTQFPAIPESSQFDESGVNDNPDTPTPTAAEFGNLEPPAHSREPSVRIPPKLGVYPFDPYDSTLLDSDKSTYTLLRRINPTDTPSFCHFGNDPPSSILDLGSGQGHWILDAAIHWKGYGTQITGVDLADTMRVLRPLAVKNGVAKNIRFVRSNFLNEPLPFPDQSFDFVRMANLTYAISYNKWEYVLGEVCRVLTIGGRLELIDDHIFFPYGKPVLSPSKPLPINDNQRGEPNAPDDTGLYDAYRGADDDENASDTATLNGNRAGQSSSSDARSPPRRGTAPNSTPVDVPNVEFQYWAEQMDASQELETLFEHMMNFRYGIHLCPSEFIQDMLSQIFGHSREVKTMHLIIAHPDAQPVAPTNTFSADSKRETSQAPLNLSTHASTSRSPRGSDTEPGNHGDSHSLEFSPGLVLWPSTLLPMSHTELHSHALKHSRTLLSSKPALSDYASETLDIDTEDDTFMEAMWEYDSFLNSRLNPPPTTSLTTLSMEFSTSSTSVNTERDFRHGNRRSDSDHNSIYSTASVTSDTRSAIWDYDFELRHHFAWPMDDSQHSEENIRPGSAGTMRANESSSVSSPQRTTPIPGLQQPIQRARPQSLVSETYTISSDLPSFTSHEPVMASNRTGRESTAPPDYSATEPTHVRTFHVYEAIKMDPALFAPN